MEQQVQTPSAGLVTTRSAGIRYGLISALVGIVYFIIIVSLGLEINEGIYSWIRLIFPIVFVALAHKYFKENGTSYMEYGQGVSISVWLGLISSLIGSAFFYVYVKFIDTNFIEAMKNVQIAKMEEKGMSSEQIDQAMSFSSAFFMPETMFVIGLITGFLFTLVVGLIVSIFTQKKAPVTF